MAPSVRGTQGDLLQHAKAYVPVEASSCQLTGMLMGVWQGLGTAVGSILSESGGPAIIGSGWCSHTLNALVEYNCSKWRSRSARLADVAG